jgi:hypothetical protein
MDVVALFINRGESLFRESRPFPVCFREEIDVTEYSTKVVLLIAEIVGEQFIYDHFIVGWFVA